MPKYHPACSAAEGHRFSLEQEGENVLVVIGLNPSTADETAPDPTMRSVLRLADACGYDGYVMLNLSSQRTPKPENLSIEPNFVMAARNLSEVERIAKKYPDADVLAAFGNNIALRPYLASSLGEIFSILGGRKRRWLRIGGPRGLTKAGHPRHPLYAGVRDGLEEFDIGTYLDVSCL